MNGPRELDLTRRRFLALSGAAVAGTAVAGCGGGDDGSAAEAPTDDASDLGFPAIENVPEGDVQLRWLTTAGVLGQQYHANVLAEVQAKYPNIEIAHDSMPGSELSEVVGLGVRNQSAHDVFVLPDATLSAVRAVEDGWVQPLDDFIPDFENWKAGFPEGSFFDNINVFDGKTYTFPIRSNKIYDTMVLYDKQLYNDAGYDPATEPLTWDTFRAAAKAVTDAGDGRSYGLTYRIRAGGNYIANMARMAGSPVINTLGGFIDPRNGEFAYTSDEFIAAIELFQAMFDDGSILPGSLSMNPDEIRARMLQGAGGMVMWSPFNVDLWREEDPTFEVGVAAQPVPDGVDPVPLGHSPINLQNSLWLFAGSELGDIAGAILAYEGSMAGQRYMAELFGGVSIRPYLDEALAEIGGLDEQAQQVADLTDEMILVPDPLLRNPDVVQVNRELRAITPTFDDVVEAIFIGEETDVRKAMQGLKDRSEEEFDRAVDAAVSDGATLSREDWVFPNLDPRSDYTPDMYEQL
ncbi:ABC transporter substrate-binding protein [Phytoactinopolyspora endophytica]|uniref:ABC transporter substrate-binding protein n=1 Tax=Phytoactinopolyspora endophytica TaxID=1642495 RepID=UPI0013EDB7D2|nr:extracellular solute-binding protein [Phytoactinopolyspora endophytica]